MKYFSKRDAAKASVDRDLALFQKRKRVLWDKKEQEFKVGIDVKFESESSFEYLVLDGQDISEKQFEDFQQPEKYEIIYVDKFDDSLWSGYPIIEPTRQMKEYKKQEMKVGK